jgi:hypothetical protein
VSPFASQEEVSTARKVGQNIARGDCSWLIRVYLGRDHKIQKVNRCHTNVPVELASMALKIVIDNAVLRGSPQEQFWQRVATVYSSNGDEFRLYAPPKATGSRPRLDRTFLGPPIEQERHRWFSL